MTRLRHYGFYCSLLKCCIISSCCSNKYYSSLTKYLIMMSCSCFTNTDIWNGWDIILISKSSRKCNTTTKNISYHWCVSRLFCTDNIGLMTTRPGNRCCILTYKYITCYDRINIICNLNNKITKKNSYMTTMFPRNSSRLNVSTGNFRIIPISNSSTSLRVLSNYC